MQLKVKGSEIQAKLNVLEQRAIRKAVETLGLVADVRRCRGHEEAQLATEAILAALAAIDGRVDESAAEEDKESG